MPRIYKARGALASFDGSTTNGEFLQIACAADKVIQLVRIRVGQSTSETDDSSSITLSTRTAAKTSGTAVEARPVDPGDAADSATLESLPTTGAPTDTIQDSWDWGALAGMEHIWVPEERFILGGQDVAVFKFTSGITAVTLEFSLTFIEIG